MAKIICQKCGREFPEKEIDESHDIPKYMGGTDLDGRHNLCKKCHNNYEWEVIKVGIMKFVANLNAINTIPFREGAKIVRSYFFKNQEKEDDTKTITKSRV